MRRTGEEEEEEESAMGRAHQREWANEAFELEPASPPPSTLASHPALLTAEHGPVHSGKRMPSMRPMADCASNRRLQAARCSCCRRQQSQRVV